MDIIKRLEKATGPDRVADGAITAIVHPTWFEDAKEAAHYASCPAVNRADIIYLQGVAPRYTASIDAAMTLVPEGPHWDVGVNPQGVCVALVGDHVEKAATPALALCIAALKARDSGSRAERQDPEEGLGPEDGRAAEGIAQKAQP